MRISKLPVTIISFVLFVSAIHAQFAMPDSNRMAEIKKRQLIVIVNPPDQDIVNKYTRDGYKEAAQGYQQVFDDYNDGMKSAVQKFWNFTSGEILFKSWAEVNDIINDKSQRNKYVLIYCFSAENHKGLDWAFSKNAYRMVGSKTYFAVDFPGDDPMSNFNIPFSDLTPTANELTYLVSTINFNFNYMVSHGNKFDWQGMQQQNAHILAGKTLLLSYNQVNAKVVDAIGTYYPCKYRVVEDSAMKRAIASGDASCAYLIPFTYDKPMVWIVSCADGAVLGHSQVNSEELARSPKHALKSEFFQDIGTICGGKK